jgi:cyclophilin family peptidyl-prolyl cis-trans isomerase
MPRTTDKRSAARRTTRVQRAHTNKIEGAAVRRRPISRRGSVKGTRNIFQRYPVAFALLLLLVVGSTVYTLYAKQIIFAPTPPAPKHYPALPASAANSPCLGVAQYLQTTTPLTDSANIQRTYTDPPPTITKKDQYYCVGITTTKGFMLLELDPRLAPNAVNNFVYLAERHFYDGLTFHRVERKGQTDPDGSKSNLDLIQGGDPKGTGEGGPGYAFKDELDETAQGKYTIGTVAMANNGPDTNGSQFFICTGDDSSLPHSYSLFGHLVKGIDTAVNTNQGDKMLRVLVMPVPIPPSQQTTPTPSPATSPTASPTLAPTPTK